MYLWNTNGTITNGKPLRTSNRKQFGVNGRVHKLSLKVINEKKHCKFKTWCKGDKSNIENSTDHFCEETKMHWLPLQI